MNLLASLFSFGAGQPAIVQEARADAPAAISKAQAIQQTRAYHSPIQCAVSEFWDLRAQHGDDYAMACALEAFADAHVAQSHNKNAGRKMRTIARYYVAREAP